MGQRGRRVESWEIRSYFDWRRRGASITTIAAIFNRSRWTVYRGLGELPPAVRKKNPKTC